MLLAATLVVLILGTVHAGAGPRPRPVDVPRCCRNGEVFVLDDQNAGPLEPAAVPSLCRRPTEPAPPWAPLIYAPARRTFLERGQLPPHWQVQEAAVPSCTTLVAIPDQSTSFLLWANNGSMLVRGSLNPIPPSSFCAETTIALLCEEAAPRGTAKCCGSDLVLSDVLTCVRDTEASAMAAQTLRNLTDAVLMEQAWPRCSPALYSIISELDDNVPGQDGSLTLGGVEMPAGTWCADALLPDKKVHVMSCSSKARGPEIQHLLYGFGLAISALFLMATLVASLALPAAHHALHWRCQTHYVATLMLGDTLLAVTQIIGGNAFPPTLCRGIAICMYFLFLSAFFWLNTMCFNIWWTFRDFRPTSAERSAERWRLRVYMVYAWGGPMALALAAAVLDALPEAETSLLRPKFAVKTCWFYGDLEILAYFFGPVGVLLLVNLALFISTARQLTCGLWRRDEVKSTSERAALGRVCAKLVIVMGVTWCADVISWVAGGPAYLWYVTDLLNALQGVFIFVVVGCQPHAAAALRRVWGRIRRAGGIPSRPTLHSSTHLPSCGDSLTQTTPAPQASTTPRVPLETVC